MKNNLLNINVCNVVNHLKVGRENAIKHDDLMRVTHMSDRLLRRALEVARLDHCIINNQDGRGYYLAETKEEAERYDKQEKARAKAIHRRRRGTRKFLKSFNDEVMKNEK